MLATDPDCDRMGAAVRNPAGRMELLTGNQTGALLTDYRLTQLKELGLVPAAGSGAGRGDQDLCHHAAAGRDRRGRTA